jgi:hypothetical protein
MSLPPTADNHATQPTMAERIKALLRGFGVRGEQPKSYAPEPSGHSD